MTVHVFGIRHHGPGSARSLRRALEALSPDAVLVEGPPDADGVLPLAGRADMTPPVALLVYDAQSPRDSVYYPFASFSPEWQALRYALERGVSVRFMDLPQSNRLARERTRHEADKADEADERAQDESAPPEDGSSDISEGVASVRRDPLTFLAEAAGYDDGERWWSHMVEERMDGEGVFEAILEAMTALRAEVGEDDDETLLREAAMRRTVREAVRGGAKRVAVVCGAWHAPAIAEPPAVKTDNERLKGLPRRKTAAAWIPWTYSRLSSMGGYGAGVASPGWYDHLWTAPDRVTQRWMTRVARSMRRREFDVSSSHVIEATRLADTLAAMRGRPLPDLSEMNDAVRAVICFGDDSPMALVERELIVGERLGRVSADAPAPPLQRDLEALQKRLRLKPTTERKLLELDLRKPGDLERSLLLHRLDLLNIPWGEGERASGKGTFREHWQIEWQPEFAVRIVEAGRWGNTVHEAAQAFAVHRARSTGDLPELTVLLQKAVLAELSRVLPVIVDAVEDRSAHTSDTPRLMAALPPLAAVLRYGDVRRVDGGAIEPVVERLAARIAVGLPAAYTSLNDEAAEAMQTAIRDCHRAIDLLDRPGLSDPWLDALEGVAAMQSAPPLVRGALTRLLMDTGRIDAGETGVRLSRALSRAVEPERAAAWIEGFLGEAGLVLVHDDGLWNVVDSWVADLADERFVTVLPLLRRTFSRFASAERRQLGQKARRGRAAGGVAAGAGTDGYDRVKGLAAARSAAVLLGLAGSEAER